MTTIDRIVELIDNALDDTGPDAMRWTPEPVDDMTLIGPYRRPNGPVCEGGTHTAGDDLTGFASHVGCTFQGGTVVSPGHRVSFEGCDFAFPASARPRQVLAP